MSIKTFLLSLMFVRYVSFMLASARVIDALDPDFRLARRSLPSDIYKVLGSQLSSAEALVLPKNNASEFSVSVDRWTDYDSPSASAVVLAQTVADVVATVKYAKDNGVQLLTMTTGDGWSTTLGTVQNALYLNVKGLDDISFGTDGKSVIVGGGVTIEEIVPVLYAAGKQIPIGSCNCPGLVSLAFGGGIGRLNGVHGFLLDNVKSFSLVLATGELVNVSDTSNPELFWALRGAGHNFGVAVSMELQIYDEIDDGIVFVTDLIYSADKVEQLFSLINNTTLPPGLAIAVTFSGNETSPGKYEAVVGLNLVYDGSAKNDLSVSNPFLSLGYEQGQSYNTTWDILNSVAGGGATVSWCDKGDRKAAYTAGLRSYNSSAIRDAFEIFNNMLARYPEASRSWLLFEGYGFGNPAVQSEGTSSTAYAHRAVNYYVLFNAWYTNAENDEVMNGIGAQIRGLMYENSGFSTQHTYINYAHGDEDFDELYGSEPWRKDRLRQLKTQYDPDCVFCAFHKIAPADS